VFLKAALLGNAWVVQATSPEERRYKDWSKEYSADMFVMDYFSISEIAALGLV
jgi:hypothetical protein